MTATSTGHPGPPELLPQYLARLEMVGGAPDRALLERLMARHLACFPFSSVSVRLREPMPLASPSLFERLVVRSRGGYCFEQNRLLQEMLDALGFRTRLLLARVIYHQDIHPGLTHRMMLVDLGGAEYVVDAGFGPLGPRVPIPFDGTEVADGWRRFRVAELPPGEFHVQLWKDADWYSLYRFELHRYGESDCELGHFYSHRHPAAAFVNHLVVARLLPDRILSLRNTSVRTFLATGETERTVTDARDLHRLLIDEFGVALSPEEASRLFAELD
jgi:N-hydroxyarylamine O-acetyltransferase